MPITPIFNAAMVHPPPCRPDTTAYLARYEPRGPTLAAYPPHPEEGASTALSGHAIIAWRPSRRMGRPHGSRRRARDCGLGVARRSRLLTMKPGETVTHPIEPESASQAADLDRLVEQKEIGQQRAHMASGV